MKIKLQKYFQNSKRPKTSPNIKLCFMNIVDRSTSIQWLCLQQPCACPVTVVLALKIASNSNLFNGSMWKRWHLSGLSVHPSDFSCWNGPQLPPAPPAAFSWKCNDDFVVHTLQVTKPKNKLNTFCNMYSDLNCLVLMRRASMWLNRYGRQAVRPKA